VAVLVAAVLLFSTGARKKERGDYPFLIRNDIRVTKGGGRSAAWMPDSRRFVFLEDHKDTVRMWLGGPDRTGALVLLEGDISLPAVSGDGKIAYVRRSGSTSEIMQLTVGGEPAKILDVKGTVTSLSWSPDGKYLAYCYFERNSSGKIAVYNFAEKESKEGPVRDATECAWSPDGGRLAIVRTNRLFGSRLILAPVKDGRLRNPDEKGVITQELIKSKSDRFCHPTWAPNGAHIAFALRRENGRSDIAVFDLKKSRRRLFTFDGAANDEPSWSPDGLSILFTSRKAGRTIDLWKISIRYR